MRAPIGLRISSRRRALGISQAALAQQAGISASYLNLIEHNRRQVGGALLLRLAHELKVDIGELSGEAEHRLIADVDEALADPVLQLNELGALAARDLVAQQPAAALAIARLHRAYLGAQADADDLCQPAALRSAHGRTAAPGAVGDHRSALERRDSGGCGRSGGGGAPPVRRFDHPGDARADRICAEPHRAVRAGGEGEARAVANARARRSHLRAGQLLSRTRGGSGGPQGRDRAAGTFGEATLSALLDQAFRRAGGAERRARARCARLSGAVPLQRRQRG